MTGAAVLLGLLAALTFWVTLAITLRKPYKAPRSDETPTQVTQ